MNIEPADTRRVFVFPGQGSQQVGMGRDLTERWPGIAGEVFARADEILDHPLSRICFQGPGEELTRTENTQPALFTVSVAALRVLGRLGIRAVATAGHSVGEYAALVAAGAIDFEEALPVVRLRGELMAAAAERTPGTMAAIVGLTPDRLEAICREAQHAGVVEPSNLNAPTQIVISGQTAAVDAAMDMATRAGARAVRLNVSAPFHCRLMEPIRSAIEPALRGLTIRDPQIPLIANATGDYVSTAGEVRRALLDQLASPVLWTATVERLISTHHPVFVEVGPGKVLRGLIRAVDRYAVVEPGGTADDIERLTLEEPEVSG